MTKKNNAAAFLANMKNDLTPPGESEPTVAKVKIPAAAEQPASNSRKGLKHIGGYLDAETVEKVAILRARLNLDNSELITKAINDLYSRQQAKKAFND
jgi:hypothetical protein